MFGITYDTWKLTCQMYFYLDEGSKKSYLQWFPFSRITKDQAQYISSKEFFDKYIKKATFVLFPEAMHQSENFLQKGDGSFRDSSLLSPVLYLVIQVIGKEISNYYESIRNKNINVFYGGNYDHMRPKYKKDYHDFYKKINDYCSKCHFFIKTDVTNFFQNINLDILINQIDERSNTQTTHFNPLQLKMIKELLVYCGDGKFPTIENSIASSYLATIVYMDEIDNRIYQFIKDKIDCISDFKIIRYVDDMYILINSSNYDEVHEAYKQIIYEYSSILREYGLSLNKKKCCLEPVKKINNELKKSLYAVNFNKIQYDIEDLFKDKFQKFLDSLLSKVKKDYIDVECYNLLINQHFSSDAIEFTPSEVYNYLIYECKKVFQDKTVIKTICSLIENDVTFISLDPKRLSIMIMKTYSEKAIKALLNQLFERNKKGLWNLYDTSIAISYLIQREFMHIDLKKVLFKHSSKLENYHNCCCSESFLYIFRNERINKYLRIIGNDRNDWRAYFIYFMYWVEKKRHNTLAEYAFYKNYFDCFTAFLASYNCKSSDEKKTNFNKFYKKINLQKFYKEIDNSEEIIKRAHDLRNANPLCHASAELIDKHTTSEIKDCIKNLNWLIREYIKTQRI